MQSFLKLSLYLRILKVSEEDLIFVNGQVSYVESRRTNKLKQKLENRKRLGVNNVDSDFVVSNNDLLSKKQLFDTISGKQNVCVAQTSDNNDALKLLEAMCIDITQGRKGGTE